MAIPPWAAEVLRRGVGGVLEKVPTDTVEQLKKRATDLLAEFPQSAARSVDSVLRSAKLGKESIQRWTRRHVALVTPVVNGSGCLCHPQISSVPLASEAIDVVSEALHFGSLRSGSSQERLAKRLAKCVAPGDYGVLITASVDGACLAVGNAFLDASIYFHRSQSQRLPSGTPIPDAFAAGVSLRRSGAIHEVGSIDRVDSSDSRSVQAPAVLVSVENGMPGRDWYRTTGASEQTGSFVHAVYMPVAVLQPDSSSQDAEGALPSMLQRLQAGAGLVIAPGNGALGGPTCGLIVGDRKRLDAIAKSAVWPAVVAEVATQAAMTMTLELLASTHATEVPAQAMIQTSSENLRSRAERLATRLAAEPLVRTCQITDKPATLSPAGAWSLPSRQLKLTHRDLSAADWAVKLLGEVPAVVVGVEDSAIVVDLRWIQPSDDVSLVATLVGQAFVPATSSERSGATASDSQSPSENPAS